MKWLEITVTVTTAADTAELAQELVGDIFYDRGFSGLAIDGPNPLRQGGYQIAVSGYIAVNAAAAEKQKQIRKAANRLAEGHSFTCHVLSRQLDDQNWANAWKKHFYPQKIGEKIVVKPTWRDYTAEAQEIVIELDPGMAFGTGTHPTTRMCVEKIEHYLTNDGAFLDIGTGSGLLMIVAEKTGAGRICGTDNDPVAIRVARENLQGNHIPATHYELYQGDLVNGVRGRFDCISANILTEVIISLIPMIPPLLKPEGYFICSGITVAGKHMVEKTLHKQKFQIVDDHTEDEWVCLVATKAAAPL